MSDPYMTGFSSSDQASIITFMGELYQQVLSIEAQFRMLISGSDMRPRIDYFHDAVRDFTAGIEGSPRLRVESLAYDMQMLRYLTQTPLAPLQPSSAYRSPSQEVVVSGPALVENTSRPDRIAKQQLAESYQKYAVLFAALLRPAADLDYRERTDALNDEVRDIHSIIQQLEGRANPAQVQAQVNQLETAELRALLSQFLQAGKHKQSPEVKKLVAFLKAQIQQRDKALKILDKAHMNGAMAQLGLFEDAKDMVKSLASKGMNLVGRFVQASISETRRQMGR
jgi:hypothetical protein